MRKRLQIVLMASLAATTSFLSTPQLRGDDEGGRTSAPITASDEHGRTIYVNDATAAPARHTEAAETPKRILKYWSSKENRWKPVPAANAASMKAARSAAAEVNEYMGGETRPLPSAESSLANIGQTRARFGDVDSAIELAAARHNVDPNLVRAVVKVESNFNPNAVSRKGAMGLMQLMPATARQLKVNNPFDPEQNVDAGVRHLKQLLQSYNGDIKLTLAAYNAGAGAVARSSGVPRYAETQDYVRRITNLYYSGLHFNEPVNSRDPVKMERDARGVLYISNTD
jgi:soluble lytic murein transglycosylase-like protein